MICHIAVRFVLTVLDPACPLSMEGETENKNQRNNRNKEKVRENLNSTNAKKYGKFNLKLAKRKSKKNTGESNKNASHAGKFKII